MWHCTGCTGRHGTDCGKGVVLVVVRGVAVGVATALKWVCWEVWYWLYQGVVGVGAAVGVTVGVARGAQTQPSPSLYSLTLEAMSRSSSEDADPPVTCEMVPYVHRQTTTKHNNQQ